MAYKILTVTIIFIILAFSLFTVFAAGETLYVCVGGDGSDPSDGICAHAWSRAYFNDTGSWGAGDCPSNCQISAGDTVVFLDDGGDFTGIFYILGSGSSGSPITIQGENSSVTIKEDGISISGTWTNEGGGVYSISYNSEPTQVYVGDTQLIGGKVAVLDSWTAKANGEYASTGGKHQWCPAYVIEDPSGSPIELAEGSGVGLLNNNEYYCNAGDDNNFYVKLSSGSPSGRGDGYITLSVTDPDNLPAGSYYWDASQNKLYVRMPDDSFPSGLTVATYDNCFTATDESYITIKDITCKKTKEDAFKFTYTANGGNLVFDGVATENTGMSGIFVDAADGLTISNIIIQNSTIKKFVRSRHFYLTSLRGEMGAITLGTGPGSSIWSGTEIFDTVTITKNYIDYGDKYIPQSTWDVEKRSGDKTTVFLNRPTNFTITHNKIIGGDHQIYLSNDPGGDCGTSTVAYNWIEDGYDDNLWMDYCATNTKTDVLIYGNVMKNSGDDGMDVRGSKAMIMNNTIISPGSDDGSGYASGSATTEDITFINNIIYFDDAPDCHVGVNSHCFIELRRPISEYTFNNNIYWYDGTDTIKSFYASDASDLNGNGTFAQWQALSSSPDADSYFFINPKFNLSTARTQKRSIARFNGNQTACTYINKLIDVNAAWGVGSEVATVNVCAPSIEPKLDIGAFNISDFLSAN